MIHNNDAGEHSPLVPCDGCVGFGPGQGEDPGGAGVQRAPRGGRGGRQQTPRIRRHQRSRLEAVRQ